MRVYQAEKINNINFETNDIGSSLAFFTAQAKINNTNISTVDSLKTISTIQTIEELIGQKQSDLSLIVAILVSTGWNLNDDVFIPGEVWKARKTPIHKPINDNHKADRILGHIVQTRALDKLGNEIDSGIISNEFDISDIIPSEFDIEVAGVLYRAFPELSDRINEIIAKAKTGEIFVSMEAWFPDFGYGIIDPATGDTKLIDRNEKTAFLTKHLRIYGGSGEYNGYKIGRVLKDIIFGAQGFVDVPANPESIIKVAAQNFVTAELNELSKGGVEDVDDKQVKEFQVKLDEALANLASKNEKIVELESLIKQMQKVEEEIRVKNYDGQIMALNAKIEELTASITMASQEMKTVEAEKTELQVKLDEAIQRANRSETELKEIRKTEIARNRFVQLSEVKNIEDEGTILAELREMTDETFAVVLKYAGNVRSSSDESGQKNDEDDTVIDDVEGGQAEAALDNVDEDGSPEFSVTEDVGEIESNKWIATAKALCGQEDINK